VVAAPVPVPAPAPALPAPEPKYPWKSSVSAGLTLTRGNSHSMLFAADVLTEKKTKENELSFGAGISYGSQGVSQTITTTTRTYTFDGSEDNVNNYKAFGQWNHLFSEKFYGYLRADALRDIISDIDYRLNIGPGAGYYLIKKDATTLAVEAGGGVQFQRIGDIVMVGANLVHSYKNETYATVRFGERFEHKFKDRARVWQSVEFLPQVDEFDNYVVNFQIGAEASFNKSFSLKTVFEDTYQSVPASGRLKNDAKIVSGVVSKF
jgi:putative salt-induced outer membrane protein